MTRPEDQPWEPASAQGSWCVLTPRYPHAASASSPALGHRMSYKEVSMWLKSPAPLLDDTIGTPRLGPASPSEPFSDHTCPPHSLRPQPGPRHQAGGRGLSASHLSPALCIGGTPLPGFPLFREDWRKFQTFLRPRHPARCKQRCPSRMKRVPTCPARACSRTPGPLPPLLRTLRPGVQEGHPRPLSPSADGGFLCLSVSV